MSGLAHREDRLDAWRGFTAGPILLLPAVVDAPGRVLDVLLGAVVWFLLIDINFVLHQHVHAPFTRHRVHNLVLDWSMSIATGMCAHNWREQHIRRHHAGDDQWGRRLEWAIAAPSAGSAWVYSFGKAWCMFWLPLLGALRLSSVNPGLSLATRLASLVQHVFVLALNVALIVIEPWFYGPFYLFVHVLTTRTDFDNHVGRTGIANSTVHADYNAVRRNFGYHAAHHHAPSAHWTTLPTIHAAISPRLAQGSIEDRRWVGYWTPVLAGRWLKKLVRHGEAERGGASAGEAGMVSSHDRRTPAAEAVGRGHEMEDR